MPSWSLRKPASLTAAIRACTRWRTPNPLAGSHASMHHTVTHTVTQPTAVHAGDRCASSTTTRILAGMGSTSAHLYMTRAPRPCTSCSTSVPTSECAQAYMYRTCRCARTCTRKPRSRARCTCVCAHVHVSVRMCIQVRAYKCGACACV